MRVDEGNLLVMGVNDESLDTLPGSKISHDKRKLTTFYQPGSNGRLPPHLPLVG